MTPLTRMSDKYYAQLPWFYTGAQALEVCLEYAAKGIHATKHFSHEGDFGLLEYYVVCPNKKDLATWLGQDEINLAYLNGSLLP